MVGVSVAVWAFSADGSIGRAEGILLLLGIGVYTGSLIRQARREPTKPEDRKPATPLDFVLLAASLGMLVIGARWMVEGAVAGATALGMSELVVGLTIIATGTSLPEVATSLAAAARGERDIAVGNVIGSNLFNLMAVLGSAAVVAPGGISVSRGALTFDLPVMTAVAAATLPVFFSGHRIARWEGAVFVFYYVAYTAWLILDAVDHPALDEFRFSMVAFALPLTAFTLAAITLRTLRRRATESSPAES
jgi:cation:H+ antiporter